MQTADALVLRDIHVAAAPSWWPPAPGWWALALALLSVAGVLLAWRARRRRRLRQVERLFDDGVAAAGPPPAQVAAISALLRRAARRHHTDAVVLHGEDWLRLLAAAAPGADLSDPALRLLLLEGGFRPTVEADEVRRLHAVARPLFVAWMQPR